MLCIKCKQKNRNRIQVKKYNNKRCVYVLKTCRACYNDSVRAYHREYERKRLAKCKETKWIDQMIDSDVICKGKNSLHEAGLWVLGGD